MFEFFFFKTLKAKSSNQYAYSGNFIYPLARIPVELFSKMISALILFYR